MNRGRSLSDQGEEIVASFERREDAQRAVEVLAARGFPIEQVAIVARGLRLVERVTGRATSRRATLKGSLAGAFAGALVGLVFGALGTPFAGLALALWGLVLGALIGAVVGWGSYRAGDRGRGFESVEALHATCFDVVAPGGVAAEAARIVDQAQERDPLSRRQRFR